MAEQFTAAPPGLPTRTRWPSQLPQQTELQDAIHLPHTDLRDRILQALIEAPEETLRALARRMAGCAASVHLYVSQGSGTVHESVHRCKSRLCPFCARARTAHVADQLVPFVAAMKHPRHLVLTVKSRDVPLPEQLRDLRTWFAKLRRTPFWKTHVFTGVYTLEITVNDRTGLWHPHLHILFDGDFLPFKQIQRHWHDITGGSEIVWIEEVYSRDGAIRELTKYIGKPQKAGTWTDSQIRAYARATHGCRMVQTFGSKPALPIKDETPDDPHPADAWSLSVSRLVWLAGQGDELAIQACPLIADRWPHLARYIYGKHPQLEPDKPRADRLLAALAAIDAGHAPRVLAHPPPDDPRELELRLIPILEALHYRQEDAHGNDAALREDAE